MREYQFLLIRIKRKCLFTEKQHFLFVYQNNNTIKEIDFIQKNTPYQIVDTVQDF